jgi:hypothetical protein
MNRLARLKRRFKQAIFNTDNGRIITTLLFGAAVNTATLKQARMELKTTE